MASGSLSNRASKQGAHNVERYILAQSLLDSMERTSKDADSSARASATLVLAQWTGNTATVTQEMSLVSDPMAQTVADLSRLYVVLADGATERLFASLADQWRRDTAHLSSLTEIVLHPSYQQIIGMGYSVVPLILQRMKSQYEFWFWALAAITREDPIVHQDAGNMKKMTDAWLRWGARHGF